MKREEGFLLALESAGRLGGAALLGADGALIHEAFLADGMRHGRGLLLAAERCLASRGLELQAVGAVTVDIGPGSYTGLRVGVMLAKALAWGRRIPLTGVFSLDALAWEARGRARHVVAALTARRGEICAAVYDASLEEVERRGPIRVLTPEELFRELSSLAPHATLVGDAATALGVERLEALSLAPQAEELLFPPPRAVGRLGWQALRSNPGGVPVHALQPVYPRREGVSMPVLGEPVEGGA
ncbi:MAG: tRNA (adenosine(37)-N6)-threonylcarbamoyltransferase complex dimerization subunit type 1 TsaB [Planctomycetota bacterium]